MNMLRQVKGSLPLIATVFVDIAIAFFAIGRVTGQPTASAPAPTPTPTRIVPTPTPNLVLQAPRVIAAWQSSSQYAGCDSCGTINFTAKGPFDMIASCNPFQVFAGSDPSIQLQLFDGNGHLKDTVQHTCGDPNNNTVMTDVIPESVPAGQYQLQISPSGTALPVSVLILDASPS